MNSRMFEFFHEKTISNEYHSILTNDGELIRETNIC